MTDYAKSPRRAPMGWERTRKDGYVLVKVPDDHHLRQRNGYAYKHQLVAEKKLGRWLLPGEEVHHVDHNPSHNDPENLEVYATHAHHKNHDRQKCFDRRLVDEENSVVSCACGCGQVFLKYDTIGRPRRFALGHTRRPIRSAALAKMPEGVFSLKEWAAVSGTSYTSIRSWSPSLLKSRLLQKLGPSSFTRGPYFPKGQG